MRKLYLGAAALMLVAGAAIAQEMVYGNTTVTYDDRLNGTDGTNPNVSISPTARAAVNAGLGVLTGTKTAYDPASVTGAAPATSTLTVTGAAIGDFVVLSSSITLGGLTLHGYVSATDTVTFYLQNPDSDIAGVNLDSMTVHAVVMPKAAFGL
jgi:hypothetical protein